MQNIFSGAMRQCRVILAVLALTFALDLWTYLLLSFSLAAPSAALVMSTVEPPEKLAATMQMAAFAFVIS